MANTRKKLDSTGLFMLLILVIGLWWFYVRLEVGIGGEKTVGYITDTFSLGSKGGALMEFRFTTKSGQEISVRGKKLPLFLSRGDKLTIYYSTSDPNNAYAVGLGREWTYYGYPLFFIIVGLVGIFWAFPALLGRKKL